MQTIVEKLLQVVESNPSKTAIKQADNSLSYEELLQYAINFSSILLENGLTKGDRVALVIENSPEYSAYYYGAILAGGVVVPLNTSATESDILNWISHAEANFAVINTKYIKVNDTNNSIVFCKISSSGYQMVMNNSEIKNEKRTLVNFSTLDSLASIIYTSGTTGQPKGVMLSHSNLSHNMESVIKYLPISKNDIVLNVLPFYYSYGNSVMHTNLIKGATLILENSMMFPHKVVEKIQNEKVTSFYGVASTYALLLSRVKLQEYDLSSMKYIAQAGGPMPPAHIKKIMDNIPSSKFFMMYGQTEATARLAYIPSDKIFSKLGSAGKAIPDVTIEIRDEDGNKQKVGAEGEIYATGNNIMQGYWKNPEMTDDVLIDGWLRTGDIAKIDSDGYIYMTGRRTDMIKSGANRISPKEIEEKLAELEGIEESAAIGMPDDILGQVIKVYVVKSSESDLDKMSILKHCKTTLAQYKIPKEIEFVQSLPKTASGNYYK